MVMENSIGLMADHIEVVGKEVNNMEKECTKVLMAEREKVNGKMATKSSGLMNEDFIYFHFH
jgi:hypothetical protein